MPEYFRREHDRYRNGQWETVQGHWVSRDGGYGSVFHSIGLIWPRHFFDENKPNAVCPKCGEEVWFFRNQETGGCAYFDAIGKPWPKHPCMDASYSRVTDRRARFEYYWTYLDERRFDFADLDLDALSPSELRTWIMMLRSTIERYLHLANALTANSSFASAWKKANPSQELPSRDSRRLWKLEASLQFAEAIERAGRRR